MKKFYCPINDVECPYWKKDGSCKLGDEGLDPFDECDDFAACWDEDDEYWEEDEG